MRELWGREALLLGLLLALGWLAGMLTGYYGWCLLLAVGAGLGRHLYQLHRLERWLRLGRKRNPPQSWGVWGDVFEQYYSLQRRHYKRKKRLGKVIREFRESTAAMPDGTLVLDGEFRIVWFNDAARQMLRLNKARDLGQRIGNLVRSPGFNAYLRSQQYDNPTQISSPVDDSRELSARLIPYGTDQYLALFRDVTRMHRLQAMRRDFVANASHELRSPITVLAGYLETMTADNALGPEWGLPLREMQAQCQRMTSLINDLLELSRLETEESEAPDDETVDVPALIRRIIQYARAEELGDSADERDIQLADCEPVHLAGAEQELHSAFSNLIINAARYSGEQGKVQVRWQLDDDGRPVFEVSDNGIGIDEKHLPFITQRFYRVNSSHRRGKGGTGLGLAIVKHVLQRHGADLEVDSKLGVGSVFRCRFPAVRARKPVGAPRSVEAASGL
jgi:two-component system phosphate regulon sensor histidine kinase PhoR